MRVSSGMIFDAGVSGINRQTASLLHLQQQVSSGRRILTPSDDPVAAARALEVTQASDVLAQFTENHDNANSALGLEEAHLSSSVDLLARVRELAVQGGNTSLTLNDRFAITAELRARFEELTGIANATDGGGQYLFAGYMGSTKPFGGTVESILSGGEIVYQGDDGQRKLQVSPTRFLEVSDSGNDVFKRIRSGNGYFATNYAGGNTGTGVVTSGAVTNPAAWNAATTKNVAVKFTVTAGVTSYDLVDTVSGNSLLTGAAAPAPLVSQRTFQSGQPVVLSQAGPPAFDLGASVTINGAPANGDSFSVAPSTSQSVFVTLAKLIGALEAPAGTPAANAKLSNDIGFALTNLDQATDNILRIQTRIGSRMAEIDSLSSVSEDLSLQYQQTLSQLQDLDYAKAISDLTRKQVDLQAAQQSFVNISQLSLFNYL
ncbi:MAG: flagellar hook-associated protein FlgL [Sulfuritalea sp.]|nr:flagellar hook-associated protein FlgL [Sulfuritalea sp.]